MLTIYDHFFISILDAIAHGKILNDVTFWETSGYKVFDFETMIDKIKNGTVKTRNCNRNNEPDLFIMITKTLAILLHFPHHKDLEKITVEMTLSKNNLEKLLEELCGKEVNEKGKYENILNQQ
jgi:hypothetical protein